ncbi:454R [Invertebrate iridescent virus 6]|uniref:Putative DNA-directed RNA polymerase subunit 454R n=1 Tax=Invertebrate iridescent virus 6 TaxID=176652 RepID=454R_IIV6|nr:454R [Invertebrate iridescent virus 6]Q91F72.1 RecName: Full=Putative DNA-directed RNA polymerase subunit 454R [Invertebrate iridescent virus 6]AAK82314.1 454R [Invertebrate iridescent virus 6]QMS79478.1 hypothetical protein IIV6-T1_444 [Invertebrate iridescent virus 6]
MFSKSYQITKEMYEARGWQIIKEDELTILAKVNSRENTNPEFAIAKFIKTTQEIKSPPLSQIIDFSSNEYVCVTIICDGSITTNVKKIEQTTKGKVEIFHNKDLQMNITKYHLQPLFNKLLDEEAKDFKKKYIKCKIENGKKIILQSFPSMSKSDPIARFFKYQSGDVIKITNKDGFVSYRIVK